MVAPHVSQGHGSLGGLGLGGHVGLMNAAVQPMAGAGGSVNNPFTCPNCGKGYTYKGNLNRHIRVECGKEPQHTCPVCFKMFKHKSNMEMHIERVHVNKGETV